MFNIKLKSSEQQILFKTLSELLESGFNLKESLIFIKQTIIKESIIDDILTKLEQGYHLSYSIRKYIDGEFYNQIYISEKNGNLINCLKEINKYISIKNRQNKKIQEVLIYPIFLIIMLSMALIGINKVIVPQMSSIGTVENYNLSYFYLCIFSILILISLIFVYYKNLSFLKRKEFLIKVPFIGKIYQYYMGYYLSYNLYLMLNNGIDIKNILFIMNSFEKSTIIYSLSNEIKSDLEKGMDYTRLIQKYNFIPKEFVLFLSQGNSKEKIMNNLFIFSRLQFEEMINKSNRLINLVQPILFLLIGIGIILGYLSILMPIYNSLRGI
ncbi:type II secretion system F family protein [Apilactobacillus quenuiae]|uniref:type II secretion system F family protein n=1 Tax=Apilactobacillus quenuiae TaxID=2008377 RepID=UPI00142D7AAE|nr:type II secretion system F family protein [Apilactobacillus quenuiae]